MSAWIGFGGALGALIRWTVLVDVEVVAFPWRTMLINVIGTIALVIIAPRISEPGIRTGFAIGFCGGLTTVSTLAFEVTELVHRAQPIDAAAYGMLSAVVGAVAIRALRRVGAVT